MEERKKDIIKLAVGVLCFVAALIFKGFVHYALLLISFLILGYEVFLKVLLNIKNGEFFDENTLMTIATIAAAILGDYNEAVFVMMFYCIGEFLEDLAEDKSRDQVKNLIDLTPDKIHIGDKTVNPETVEIGTLFTVYPGEKISIDGIIVEGQSFLDTKAITGESVPVNGVKGLEVTSGTIVLDSPITIKSTKLYKDSTLFRIIELIENNEETKAPTERFITKFAKYYTPVVVGIGFAIAVIVPLFAGNWSQWIHKALNFLIISCPCALVISVPLSFFAGIGSCASKGILVKGADKLESLAKTQAFVFDKTGTLTKGEFKVQQVYSSKDSSKEEVLKIAYALESNSLHPIAKAITDYCKKENIKKTNVLDLCEIPGNGISSKYKKEELFVGNDKLMKKNNIQFNKTTVFGTVVHVATSKKYLGYIVVSDSIKDNAKDVIQNIKQLGVQKAVMLSGDNEKTVNQVASIIGIDECFAGLYPDEKAKKIEELKKSYICTYCGDGINDIPVMLSSDTSISMGKIGSDAAIEASGIVFTNDDLSKLVVALKASKKTVKIAKQNVILALAVKVLCLVLSMLGITGLTLSVFADTGVALLAILNSLRALY